LPKRSRGQASLCNICLWYTSLMDQAMNPDSYSFIAYCPQCKEKRGVSCSRADIRSGRPMQVYAVACDHSWTLSPKDSQKLRENTAILT
jgi:hypothetical protein